VSYNRSRQVYDVKLTFRWNETERTIVRHSSRTLSLFCFTHHQHGTSYVTEVTRIFKKEYAKQIFFLENYDRLPWLLFTFLYTEARVDFPPLKLRFAENLYTEIRSFSKFCISFKRILRLPGLNSIVLCQCSKTRMKFTHLFKCACIVLILPK